MTKTAQAKNTVYQQGFADGRKGRPFRYNKPKRRTFHIRRPHLWWYYLDYKTGYENGVRSRQVFWLHRILRNRWIIRGVVFTTGMVLAVGLLSIIAP